MIGRRIPRRRGFEQACIILACNTAVAFLIRCHVGRRKQCSAVDNPNQLEERGEKKTRLIWPELLQFLRLREGITGDHSLDAYTTVCLAILVVCGGSGVDRESRNPILSLVVVMSIRVAVYARLHVCNVCPKSTPSPQEEGPDSPSAAELCKLEDEQLQLKSLLREDSLLLHSKFHPDWGQLFKSGYQDSRFATQVLQFVLLPMVVKRRLVWTI